MNQETSINRPGDTHWSSHYGTLLSLTTMLSSMIEILNIVGQDGSTFKQKAEANALLDSLQSLEFVFNMHLMKIILGITNELSQVLQQKE